MAPRRSWTREKTGEDSPYLQRILVLYHQNKTSVEIGQILGKDHTTVLYHLRRLGIPTGMKRPYFQNTEVKPVELPPLHPKLKEYKYAYLFEEDDINPGKSYAEYLKEGGKTKKQIKRILAEKKNSSSLDGTINEHARKGAQGF